MIILSLIARLSTACLGKTLTCHGQICPGVQKMYKFSIEE